MRPRVRIIEDDRNLSDAIGELLDSVGMHSTKHGSAESFLAEDDGSEGCLVLDVRLPGMSGLELQRRSDALGVRLPIIFLSGHGDIAMGVAAMKAGAIDFLSKPFGDQALLDAVAVAIEENARRRAEDAMRSSATDRHSTLTPREREVLHAVAEGRRNREIAETLGLSEVTVKMHRGAAMRKMDAENLADLIRLAALVEKVE